MSSVTDFGKATAQLDDLELKLSGIEALTSPGPVVLADQHPSFQEVEAALTGPLATSMAKFKKRCHDVDPVSDQPRYGEQMRKKVMDACIRYDGIMERSQTLREAMDLALGEVQEVARQKEEALRRAQEERARALEVERQRQEARAREEAAQAERERLEAEQAQEVLSQEAVRVRELKKTAAEEAEMAAELARQRQREEDDAVMSAVAPGVAGAEASLAQLQQSIGAGNNKIYKEAVGALALYVGNIIAHPEEVQYKKIKHENVTFKTKVGQYQGGPQCLLAAGFMIERDEEGQLLYVIEEPNIEKDYPTWTAWYDGVKSVRDRLKAEEQKVKRIK